MQAKNALRGVAQALEGPADATAAGPVRLGVDSESLGGVPERVAGEALPPARANGSADAETVAWSRGVRGLATTPTAIGRRRERGAGAPSRTGPAPVRSPRAPIGPSGGVKRAPNSVFFLQCPASDPTVNQFLSSARNFFAGNAAQ